MPLFFSLNIDKDTKLAVWNIEEEESFFLDKVSLHREITHPHKQLQHLAGRYLLQHLFPVFPIDGIKIKETNKPFLENDAFHFSISHCAHYAAAIVSKNKRVGVDIEIVTPKIEKIQYRFSSVVEIENLIGEWKENKMNLTYREKLTLLWSCKEAVFKWYELGGVSFQEDIIFEKIKRISAEVIQTDILFKKETPVTLPLTSRFFDDVVLSYVIT